ncbi:DMT family transporter [Abyssalbus ytuae]|uniref:DMT family transporter n=1 Tax=Abyssalbus ytuae TaxID=2926907 RepID=A0A9E6ZUH5_9FLAO|nr:DMT family transporter [Abyssalbus ytuae]UOB19158.1 DMT family transporter [Abyssalbus ytuae]
MNKRTFALLAGFGATLIYGLNFTIAKSVMPEHIKPFGFILLRVIGASVLFWITSLFYKEEKVHTSDWPRFVAVSVFGMAANMLSFFKGLDMTTPINGAVIMTSSPILVLILSVLIIKEKITWTKSLGVFTGLVGALILILYGAGTNEHATNITVGNFLIFINATCYGLYLILAKPLTKKYHTFTILKWAFLIGIVINLPFTITEFSEVGWTTLPLKAILAMIFVVAGSTYLTYLLNVFALNQLKASTLSAFIYLQPFIATVFAVAVGSDTLSLIKIAAALMIFVGVYLVTKRVKTSK